MCMKKFDAEKMFFDKQYAGYQVSRTYCQVSLGLAADALIILRQLCIKITLFCLT